MRHTRWIAASVTSAVRGLAREATTAGAAVVVVVVWGVRCRERCPRRTTMGHAEAAAAAAVGLEATTTGGGTTAHRWAATVTATAVAVQVAAGRWGPWEARPWERPWEEAQWEARQG